MKPTVFAIEFIEDDVAIPLDYATLFESILGREPQNRWKANLPNVEKGRPSVFVAVSLSMPQASLLCLAHDAKHAQIPLVFRGGD